MAIFTIKHLTRYFYEEPVYDSINQMMLYPISDNYQKVISHKIKISDSPPVQNFNDKFGNMLGIFSHLQPHNELKISSILEIETFPKAEPDPSSDAGTLWDELNKIGNDFKFRDYLQVDKMSFSNEIMRLVQNLKNDKLNPYENAKKFSEYIYCNFSYSQGVTSVETEVDEIWTLKAGVCQDFAHFLLVMLRMIQIPARYVSGYICPENDDFRGAGATHAWVEAYIPGFDWVGLDPTNNCHASDRHIRLAIGRYFKDCTPFKGIYKGKLDHRLEVSVIVDNADIEQSSARNFIEDKNMTIEPSLVSEVKSESNPTTNSYQAFIQMQQQQQQ
ncbi:MAG: transglutaminase family protein [Saprospiraceae bacterium]